MTTTVVPVDATHPAFDRVVALFDDYRVHYGRAASPGITRAWLDDQLAHGRLTVAAAVRDGQVAGFVTVTIMPASLMLGTAWSIRDVYVARRHRRRGIAGALLQHVVHQARAAGALRVSLQTETGNLPALTLYTGIGFRPVTGLSLLNLSLDPQAPQPSGSAG
jgi:ribosomal protein S18 acetylase RimI-like enzyme